MVNANVAALAQRLVGGFNVGQGKETDVNQLAKALLAAAPQKVDIVYAAARPGEQKRSAIDPARLTAASGWHPAVAVEDGLARTFRFFREQREQREPR